MKRVLSIIFMLTLFTTGLHAADVLYVQSMRAKLKKEPGFRSETVGSVKRGTMLKVIGSYYGRWYNVSAGAKKGWVHRLSVSKNRPMKKVRVIRAYGVDIAKRARRRASAITSAAAARGLSDADRKRMSDLSRADYASLDKLEKLAGEITEAEVDDFILTGGDR